MIMKIKLLVISLLITFLMLGCSQVEVYETVVQGYEGDISQTELDKAVQVENIPEPPFQEGKLATSYINPQTLEYIYEYEDYVEDETEVTKLKKQIEALTEIVDGLVLENMPSNFDL